MGRAGVWTRRDRRCTPDRALGGGCQESRSTSGRSDHGGVQDGGRTDCCVPSGGERRGPCGRRGRGGASGLRPAGRRTCVRLRPGGWVEPKLDRSCRHQGPWRCRRSFGGGPWASGDDRDRGGARWYAARGVRTDVVGAQGTGPTQGQARQTAGARQGDAALARRDAAHLGGVRRRSAVDATLVSTGPWGGCLAGAARRAATRPALHGASGAGPAAVGRQRRAAATSVGTGREPALSREVRV